MKMREDISGYLQEHKEMRAEIRQYLDWRAKIIHFTLLLTAVAFAVAAEVGTGGLFLLTTLVVAFLWYDEIRHLVAVFRFGTYLEVFVEPEVKELNSETIGHHHRIQTSVVERIVGNGVFPAMFVLHASLMVHYADWQLWQVWVAISGLLFVFLAVSAKSYTVFRSGRQRELEAWLTLRERLAPSNPDA